jgi:DNA-binding MarR family transcriptional regulator
MFGMRRALGAPLMNAIAFGTKRAFHGFLRVTRKALGSLGLTAARFDMMCALLRDDGFDPRPSYETRQSDLRRTLGVTAPVVSRMLRALERLGLVARRRRPFGDRRQRWVELTTFGEKSIRKARRMLLRGVQRLVYAAICFGMHRDPSQRLIHMDQLEGYLRVLRHDFGDTARLYYPWGHPDD